MNIQFTIVEPTRVFSLQPLNKSKKFKSPNRNRKIVRVKTKMMKATLAKFFRQEAKAIASIIETEMNKNLVGDIMTALQPRLKTWETSLPAKTRPYLTAIAVDGAETAAGALGVTDKEVLSLMRTRATAWAENRSAEMIGRRIVGGTLVENPSAKWAITESTRDSLRSMVENALKEGSSPQELASAIKDAHAFSPERAESIARTEMAMADSAGTMESFRATKGVVGKRWVTVGDDAVSEECQESEDAGAIPLEEGFPPNGEEAPPNHPNCRCLVEPVFDDEM